MKAAGPPRTSRGSRRSTGDTSAIWRPSSVGGSLLDAVEDVLAETFVVAWRRLDDIPTEERPWLYGVARNVIRNTYRAEARQRALHVRIADDVGTTTGDGAFDDAIASRADLAHAWNQLSETEQEVIALVAWDGLGNAEAAQSARRDHLCVRGPAVPRPAAAAASARAQLGGCSMRQPLLDAVRGLDPATEGPGHRWRGAARPDPAGTDPTRPGRCHAPAAAAPVTAGAADRDGCGRAA